MENTSGNLRVLSRASSGAGVATQSSSLSSSSSAISLSSSSIPYTPPTSSNFNFPAPPTAHGIPSYPPPACPPMPSVSLLNPTSGRAFPSTNPGGKITILTSSAASSPSLLPSTTNSNVPPAEVPFSTPGSGLFTVEGSLVESPASGVVVVGAIGRSEADVSQVLNRLLDAQVFGSKGCANQLCSPLFETVQDVSAAQELERKTGTPVEAPQQPNSISSSLHKQDLTSEGQVSGGEERKEFKTPVADTNANSTAGFKGSKRIDWMKRRLSYYHDEEKGAVYVQFAWGYSPTKSISGLNLSMEDFEECKLRGLLYMFSVCHVLLLVQEGSRVDTHLLRTLRMLQNAKHLLVPFVKSHVLPGLQLTPFALDRTNSPARSSSYSAGQGSGRSGTGGRNASTIGLMSGSAPSFFPGQCTPVLLFVFLEDFHDAHGNSHAVSNGDDKTDPAGTQIGTVSQQSGGSIIPSRQAVHLKGSNAVVMLARATNRTEGGLRKKLQSSLEAQIRYLVKKCKVVGGLGDGGGIGIGPRGPGNSMGSASGALAGSSLFVLDTMRAACLLDKGPNLQCDALKAAMSIMHEILKGKEDAVSDFSSLAGNSTEDIQALRDFVWKQAEILRGRGGILTNSTGGSMGVGMVAAAAAAAAASAAAGGFGGSAGALKPMGNPPELPSMSSWLSACRILLNSLLTGEGQVMKELKKIQPGRLAGNSRRGSFEAGNVTIQGKEALGLTLGSLSSAADFDMRFSEEWCNRMFPSVLAAYTNGLPPCYPTLVHQSHLEKALHLFKKLVRGPAVGLFTDKLKADCEAIWKSGRQLCDAVSLTGRHCIHKVHVVSTASLDNVVEAKSADLKETAVSVQLSESNIRHSKPHSSGVVFLHACACGRSRRLREDPFDVETANTKFFQFPNCEDLLPSLVIPDCDSNKPMGGSAWSLVRLGGAKYYLQSTGLLQTGFSHKQKFLSPWIISYVLGSSKQETTGFFAEAFQSNQHMSLPSVSRPLIGALSFLDVLEQGSVRPHTDLDETPRAQGVADQKKSKVSEKVVLGERRQTSLESANVPSDERRLFSDVARNAFDFPPLQQRQVIQKNARQVVASEKNDAVQPSLQAELEQGFTGSDNSKGLAFKDKGQTTLGMAATITAAVERVQDFGKIGIKNALTYVGFEHECPRGHRFFLSLEQLEAFNSIGPTDDGFITGQHKSREANDNSNETRHRQDFLRSSFSTGVGQEQGFKSSTDTAWNLNVSDSMSYKILSEGSGEGFFLLNANVPIFMECPYCSKLPEKKKKIAPTFAGNISQLQRIFLVTPPLPLLIATCPSVQFDEACVNGADLKGGVGSTKFSLGCSAVLPPESFVVLRLPFVYYLELQNGSKYPLKCKMHQPERTAWLLKGTTFKIISKSDGANV